MRKEKESISLRIMKWQTSFRSAQLTRASEPSMDWASARGGAEVVQCEASIDEPAVIRAPSPSLRVAS